MGIIIFLLNLSNLMANNGGLGSKCAKNSDCSTSTSCCSMGICVSGATCLEGSKSMNDVC